MSHIHTFPCVFQHVNPPGFVKFTHYTSPSFPFQLFRQTKTQKMGVNSPVPEPEFDLNSSFVPVNVSEFFKEISVITDGSERAMKIDEYVLHLQDELNKVHAFKRQLPLCMLLLNDGTYIFMLLHMFFFSF